MKRIHIPNLFYILGASHQGKSSLTRYFRQTLDCEVIPTDQIFWRWCDKYHPQETHKARWSLGRYFPSLRTALRREWFEYLTNYLLARIKYAKPDMVIEGWLLTLMPKDLKALLSHACTLINITMRHYTAHTTKQAFKPIGKNYSRVVSGLQKYVQREREAPLMALVKHQKFEDCAHSKGRIDCASRLARFELPENLAGKRVLETACDTGYFGIRLAQRGATVYAVGKLADKVRLASQIANSIYRLPNIQFYCGDVLTEDFKTHRPFDYIVTTATILNPESTGPWCRRAAQLLAPGGLLIVDVAVASHVMPITYHFTRDMCDLGHFGESAC